MRLIAPFAALSFALAVTPALALVVGQAAPDGQAVFQQTDANGDGRITRAEFDAARSAVFSRADANRDGKLDRDEMRALAAQGGRAPQGRPSREQMERLRDIDQNGNRAIDAAEFSALGGRLFGSLDANRDGSITLDEAGALARSLGLGG